MIYICPECGSEIPEDSEFCYSCGRKRDDTIRIDDSGRFITPEKNKCTCGAELSNNDVFCQQCGKPTASSQILTFRPKMIKYGWIGILLALIPGAMVLIPGLFSIYGLGHLYFKKWKRGAVFLLMSVLMYYVKYGGLEVSMWTDILFGLLSAFIFLLQLMEVTVLAFIPPKTAE